jgi:hypothetical protein
MEGREEEQLADSSPILVNKSSVRSVVPSETCCVSGKRCVWLKFEVLLELAVDLADHPFGTKYFHREKTIMISQRYFTRFSPPVLSAVTRNLSLPSTRVPQLTQKHHLDVGDKIPSTSFFVRKRDVNEFSRSYHWKKVILFFPHLLFCSHCLRSIVMNYSKVIVW